MNKQQLIDKAIDELDGIWREDGRDVPMTMLLHSSGNKIALSGSINEWVTRQEFEARKAELFKAADEIMYAMDSSREKQSNWYDYENKKALRLPPVGEVVLFGLNGNRRKVAIVAHDLNAAIFRDETCHDDVDYYAAAQELFRPLDWDKKKNNEAQEIAEMIFSKLVTTDPIGIAKAILAAGYRKCDNKTPSDKE